MSKVATYLGAGWRQLRTIDGVRSLQYFNMLRFGATLLAGIVLAKSGLPPRQIALYEGWLFFGNLFTFYWVIGGQNAVLQLVPKLAAARRTPFFQAVWLTWLAFSGLVALLLWLRGEGLVARLTRFEQVPAPGWLALFVWWQTPAWLVQAWYLLNERFRALLAFAATAFGLQVLCVALPLRAGYGLEGIFRALALLAFAKMCWSGWLVFGRAKWQPWWGGLVRWWWAALPLMAHVLVGQSVDYIDGLIVSSRMEEHWFAIFRYGARELPLSLLLVGAVVTGTIPLVAGQGVAALRSMKERITRLGRLLFPLSMVLMLVSPRAFELVYSEAFVPSARVFNVYLLLVGSRVLLPQVLLIGWGHGRVLVLSALIETALNVALSLWWIHFWGLTGIAMASVIAYLFNKAFLMAWAWQRLGVPPGHYVHWPEWLGWNALLWTCWWLWGG